MRRWLGIRTGVPHHEPVVSFAGDRLRAARHAAGLSRTELAQRAGLRSADRIRDWESGVHAPQPRHVPRLAAALAVDPVTLFEADPSRSPLTVLRQVRGLSLQELAAAAGVAVMTCHRLEQGRSEPAPDVLARLAAVLGVPSGGLTARRSARGLLATRAGNN